MKELITRLELEFCNQMSVTFNISGCKDIGTRTFKFVPSNQFLIYIYVYTLLQNAKT